MTAKIDNRVKKKAGVEIFQNPFFNLPYLLYFFAIMSLSLRPDRKNAGKSTIVGKKKVGVEIFQNPFFNLPYLFYFMINRDKLISTIKN